MELDHCPTYGQTVVVLLRGGGWCDVRKDIPNCPPTAALCQACFKTMSCTTLAFRGSWSWNKTGFSLTVWLVVVKELTLLFYLFLNLWVIGHKEIELVSKVAILNSLNWCSIKKKTNIASKNNLSYCYLIYSIFKVVVKIFVLYFCVCIFNVLNAKLIIFNVSHKPNTSSWSTYHCKWI